LSPIAWISLAVAISSALWIGWDELHRPQRMAIMNVVWPVTALYFTVAGLIAYLRIGRVSGRTSRREGHHRAEAAENGIPFRQVAIATSHCGAGCAIADIVCDFATGAAGIKLFGSSLWAEYAIDLIAAWLLGIVFQYFSIRPMKDLGPGQAMVAAIKADTLSILAYQIGMYAWMALAYFVLFPHPHLTAFDPRSWLMMQVAMICGFMTSLPMNWWLLRIGLKEKM